MMAPSHYLNRYWLVISKVQWHSSASNFTKDTSATNRKNKFENYYKYFIKRGQWVVFGDRLWTALFILLSITITSIQYFLCSSIIMSQWVARVSILKTEIHHLIKCLEKNKNNMSPWIISQQWNGPYHWNPLMLKIQKKCISSNFLMLSMILVNTCSVRITHERS